MSNPWAEAYKDLRSEYLGEESADIHERRKLRDIKTAASQSKYDMKSRVAKMRAKGMSSIEIRNWVDNYLRNSQLPGEQKAQIRQQALSAGYEPEGELVDENVANLVRLGLGAGTALAGAAVAKKAKDVAGQIEKRNKNQQQQINKILGKENLEIDGDDIQEVAPPGAKYERMVKHIKKGYSEGGLTKKEKSIAYATAWKAKNQANEEYVVEENDYVVVRITTEDGRTFEKRVPATKLEELRKRYKSVVVVGSREPNAAASKKVDTKKESFEYISEKKKAKKLDPVGKEDGDIDNDGDKDKSDDYLMNRRKVRGRAIRGESYSDWRNELELSESELGISPSEMRSGGGQKKNREDGESFSTVTECDGTGWNEQELSSIIEDLGGELLELEVLDEIRIPSIKIPVKPGPVKIPVPDIKPAPPGPITPVKPAPKPAPTKPAPKPAPTKPAPKPAPTKPAPKPAPTKPAPAPAPGPQIKPPAPGTIVKPETKTPPPGTKSGEIVVTPPKPEAKPETKTQTKPQVSIPGGGTVTTPPAPPVPPGPGGGIPGGPILPLNCPPVLRKLGLCGIKLIDPGNVGKTVDV